MTKTLSKSKTKTVSKIMSNTVFESLMDKVVFDYGNGINNFGFHAKFQNYEVTFFVCDSQNVSVEDFGVMKSGAWIQMYPTEKQIQKMQSIIDNKIENFPNYFDSCESEESVDLYDLYGVSREMFY